jgi:hypothetical protein
MVIDLWTGDAMSAKGSQIASAEILLKSAMDLIIDAASVLDDVGEKDVAGRIKAIADAAESATELLRTMRAAADE